MSVACELYVTEISHVVQYRLCSSVYILLCDRRRRDDRRRTFLYGTRSLVSSILHISSSADNIRIIHSSLHYLS